MNRSGPPKSRIDEEKRLLMSGPLDLKKAPAASAKQKLEKEPSGIFDKITSSVSSMISGVGSLIAPPAKAKETKYAEGGMVGSPVTAKISPAKPNIKPPAPPSKPSVVVKTQSAGSKANATTKSSGGVPKAPIFAASVSTPERNKKRKILGIF